MIETLHIRESTAEDISTIAQLYRDAFPDEDLLPLVHELLQDRANVLSLVGIVDGAPAGHIAMTRCRVDGCDCAVSLLGPLAVAPRLQRLGIGGALVREGLRHVRSERFNHVCVLGDPGYYGRFGFGTEGNILPPYQLPDAWRTAWQSICLDQTSDHTCRGRLRVPSQWQRRELWAPP